MAVAEVAVAVIVAAVAAVLVVVVVLIGSCSGGYRDRNGRRESSGSSGIVSSGSCPITPLQQQPQNGSPRSFLSILGM